jgi:peptidoglycan/LPS O-acetylase OafA/YrhL
VGGDRAVRHFGGFDTLRIFAAMAVVLTHSFELTGHATDRPFAHVGRYPIAPGEVGVWIFFATSGFLVARSFARVQRGIPFAWNRFARIWPALITLILLSVFVLGPLMTTLTLHQYFSSTVTWHYLVRNLIMFKGPTFALPGVFANQPAKAINGSLWTLPYELWAYVGVLLLGVTGLLKRRYIPIGLAIVAIVTFRFDTYSHQIHFNYSAFAMSTRQGAPLAAFFLIGVVAAGIHDFDLRRLAWPASALLALSLLVREPVLFIVAMAALTLGLGTTDTRFSARLRTLGDPSYGMYIFCFPLQQTLYHAGIHTSWVMFAASAPLSVAIGYASWHIVESPALRRLKYRRKRLWSTDVRPAPAAAN